MNNDVKVRDFIPFTEPTIEQEEIDEVIECLRSRWITSGKRVERFEEAFAEYLGIDKDCVVAVNSATSGLFLTLKVLGIENGDDVITSDMTFVASANVIEHVGANTILIDIENGSYNIDMNRLKNSISKKTKAIIPVHFSGIPVDMDSLIEISGKYGTYIIEDAAHAIGTEFKDKKIGSYFGDRNICVFSLQANKNIMTGEGGFVCTPNKKIADTIRVLRFHGIDRTADNRYAKLGNVHYDVIDAGYKCNMMDIQASIGIHQLKRLDKYIDRRKEISKKYDDAIESMRSDKISIPMRIDYNRYNYKHAWNMYLPLVENRDEFIKSMLKHKIGIGYHYRAIHQYSYYENKYKYRNTDFPSSSYISSHICTLPMFYHLSESDQEYVIESMKSILTI